MRVLVTTPTGHVGSRVVERLVHDGVPLRAFVRDPGKIPVALRSRMEVWQGDLEDPVDVADGMRDVDAVLFVIPHVFAQPDCLAWIRDVARAFAAAIRAQATPPRVVFLSGIGAHRDDMGAVSALGHAERTIAAVAPDLVVLRAGSFMENLFGGIRGIVDHGAIYDLAPADRRVPLVATRDIGDVAVRWLVDDSWRGLHVVGVHGPADVSFADRARILTDVLGQRVTYVQVPEEAMRHAMAGTGMSPSVVDAYTAISVAMAKHEVLAAEPRMATTTTPTTLATWAREALLPAVKAARPVTAPVTATVAPRPSSSVQAPDRV